MADALDEIERVLKTMREVGRREAEMTALFQKMGQAIADGVEALEKRPAAPAPVVIPAPIVNVSPVIQSDWDSLKISAPVDGLGRPTGEMTITKVKKSSK